MARSTASANGALSVIRIAWAISSCSACDSRSAAIHLGSLSASATTRISDGPAIRSMPTRPKTCFFAEAT